MKNAKAQKAKSEQWAIENQGDLSIVTLKLKKMLHEEVINEFRSCIQNLLAKGQNKLIIDASSLRSMMASVMGIFYYGRKNAQQFMITGVHDDIFEVFTTIGADKEFDIYANIDVALRKLAAEGSK